MRLVQPVLKYKNGKAQAILFFNILAQKIVNIADLMQICIKKNIL